MKCEDYELLLAQGESGEAVQDHLSACAGCRAIAQELRANATVLEGLRNEELPSVKIRVRRSRKVYPWAIGAAAAAAFAIGMLLPRPAAPPAPAVRAVRHEVPQVVPQEAPPQVAEAPPAPVPTRPQKPPPLKIKMLTPDPDVVIYWIVD